MVFCSECATMRLSNAKVQKANSCTFKVREDSSELSGLICLPMLFEEYLVENQELTPSKPAETKVAAQPAQPAKKEAAALKPAAVKPAAPAADKDREKIDPNPDGGTHTEHIKAALEVLYEHFPKAFIKEGDAKPLKVGILEDLKARLDELPGVTMSKLRGAVRMYASRLRYLYTVREGVMRVDLEGNDTEPVSADHAKYAKERFAECNNKRKEKLAAREAAAKARAEAKAQQQAEARENKGKDGKEGSKPGFKPGFKKPFNKGRRPFNNNRRPGGPGAGKEGGFAPRKFTPRVPREGGPAAGEGAPRPVRKAPVVRMAAGTGRRTFSPRTLGTPATAEALHNGTSVLVSSNNHFVRATVQGEPKAGQVTVVLSSGMTMTLPVERVLLPNSPARK